MAYSFVAGQIKVLESKLLTQEQLDRMIGATSPEAAFNILVELQYAEYIQEETTISDFESILDQGLTETKAKIMKGTEMDPVFNALWFNFDVNNLKRALKIKFLEAQKSLEDFTPENGFSKLGTLSQEDVQALVFENQPRKKCPQPFWDVIRKAETTLEQNKQDFSTLEGHLDQTLFEINQKIAAQHRYSFLQTLLDFQSARINTLALARSLFIRETPLLEAYWIQNQSLSYQSIKKVTDLGSYAKWLTKTPFWNLKESFEIEFDPKSPEKGLLFLERAIDKSYFEFLEKSALGKLNDMEVPFVYFEKRVKNAKIIKTILLAKLKGMAPEKIYRLLDRFFIA